MYLGKCTYHNLEVRSHFLKIYFVKCIYKKNMLREVYVSYCESKGSLFTNIVRKIFFVKCDMLLP